MSLIEKLVLLVVLLAAVFLGGQRVVKLIDQGGYTRAEEIYKSVLADQRKAAEERLATETAKVVEIEKTLLGFKTNQDTQDAKNKTTVADLQRRLTAVAGPAGRLRDPNATQTVCRGGGGDSSGEAVPGDGDSEGDGADAGGLLSAGVTGLLLTITEKAEIINNAYISCRAQAFNDREQLK